MFGAILGAVAGPVINGIFGSSGGGGSAPAPTQTPSQSSINSAPLATGIAGQQAWNTAMGLQGTAAGQAIGSIQGGQQGLNAALQPYQAAGGGGVAGLQAAGNTYNSQPFSMAMAQNMPAYQFALQQAQGATNNAAAVGGTQLSSGNIESLQANAAGLASQTEAQAFQQYMAQNNAAQAANAQLAASGLSAAGQVGAGAMNTGLNVANEQTGLGNAQAYGTVQGANALAGGVNNTFNQPGVQSALGSAGTWLGSQVGNVFGMNGSPTYSGSTSGVNMPVDTTAVTGGTNWNTAWAGNSVPAGMYTGG